MSPDRLACREASILGDLGTTLFDVGDYRAARSQHLQAMEIARDVGDREGQAISLDTLGLVHHYLGQNADALASFHQALDLQREIGDSRGQGYTLTHLGYALIDQGDLSEAKEVFSQALSIRRELDVDSGVAIDDLAGLARVALAVGDLAQATTHVEGILAWIVANGADRIEYPVLVYLICYQVLEVCARQRPDERSRARAVLQQGVALLQRRAAAITDPGLRQQFLENVSFNHELLAAKRPKILFSQPAGLDKKTQREPGYSPEAARCACVDYDRVAARSTGDGELGILCQVRSCLNHPPRILPAGLETAAPAATTGLAILNGVIYSE